MNAYAAVLVVIPCLNEAENLPRLLTGMTAEPNIGRIVVADGGSTDGSRAIVEEFARHNRGIFLLSNPRRLQSAGINLAVAQFGEGFDYMVRVDAHCGYPPGYVGLLLAARDQQHADGVVVPMVSRGTHCFQIAAATAQNSRLGTGGSAHRHLGEGRFVDHGHHALIPLAAFRAVGGYREDMSHNEDAELDHRLGQSGVRLWLEPAAALTYQPRATPAALAAQYWAYGRGRALTVALHRMRLKPRQLAPLAVPIAVALLPLAWIHSLWALPAFLWLVLCVVGGMIAGIHQRTRCGVVSGVAAAIMHVTWGAGFIFETGRVRLAKGHLS